MTQPPRRSFSERTLFGTCESGECTRQARVTCADCSGDFCLAHATHPGHGAE